MIGPNFSLEYIKVISAGANKSTRGSIYFGFRGWKNYTFSLCHGPKTKIGDCLFICLSVCLDRYACSLLQKRVWFKLPVWLNLRFQCCDLPLSFHTLHLRLRKFGFRCFIAIDETAMSRLTHLHFKIYPTFEFTTVLMESFMAQKCVRKIILLPSCSIGTLSLPPF